MTIRYNEGELVVLTYAVEPASDKLESPQYDLDARYLGRICIVNSYYNSLYEVTDIQNGTTHTLTGKEFARLSDINIGMFSNVVRQYFPQFGAEWGLSDLENRDWNQAELTIFNKKVGKVAPRTINLVHLRGTEYIDVDSLPVVIDFKDIRKGDKIRRTIQKNDTEVARTGIVHSLNPAYAETEQGWVLGSPNTRPEVEQVIELVYRAPVNKYAKLLIETVVVDKTNGFQYFKVAKNNWLRHKLDGGIVDAYPDFWRDDQFMFDLGDNAEVVLEGKVRMDW